LLDLGLWKLYLRIVSRPRSPLVLPGSRIFNPGVAKRLMELLKSWVVIDVLCDQISVHFVVSVESVIIWATNLCDIVSFVWNGTGQNALFLKKTGDNERSS
jgi:hypothetical protein